MPDHSQTHLNRMSRKSAAKRRADKIAKLLTSSPPFSEAQGRVLQALLEARIADGAAR